MKKIVPLILIFAFGAPAFAVETKKIVLKRESTFNPPADERNPFWPIGFKPSVHGGAVSAGPLIPASSFVVSSIVLDPHGRFAIINGKTMTEGQTFGMQIGSQIHQITVKAIQDGQVILRQQDEEVAVTLRRK